ncbi:unnamed protein product, partial [Musa hybrid cultivar]
GIGGGGSFCSHDVAAVRRGHLSPADPRGDLPENCHLLAGIWCHGLTVRQLQALRGALPPAAKLVVAKNTLLEKAI